VFELAGAHISAVQLVIILGSVLMMAGLSLLVFARVWHSPCVLRRRIPVAGLMGIDVIA